MGRRRKQRRQPHGSAWHWKQTDGWYYTQPGTRKRVALFEEDGQRIHGKDNRETAELALARKKLSWEENSPEAAGGSGEWPVARVCSHYIQYCESGFSKGAISKGHRDSAVNRLNDLCKFCGALPVAQLKKSHIQQWLESHTGWRSSETHRSVIAVVLAAFNQAAEMHGIVNPLKGLKKPRPKPRLHSFDAEDEKAIYGATEPCFGNFLYAAIHTGLRPFCELAKITADEVEESQRGMMWRVYSTRTKKTRKIPVRFEVAEMTRKLMKTAPRGSGITLFRNSKGKPWKPTAGVVRFLTIKKKLSWDNPNPIRGEQDGSATIQRSINPIADSTTAGERRGDLCRRGRSGRRRVKTARQQTFGLGGRTGRSHDGWAAPVHRTED